MTSSHVDTAARYRFRAEELRAVMSDMKDETCKAALAKAADDYDRLAEMQERLAKAAE